MCFTSRTRIKYHRNTVSSVRTDVISAARTAWRVFTARRFRITARKTAGEIFLWNASGRNIVSDSGLRAAGFISDGGYMVVQNVQNGLYGVWSAEKGQLTVPCRYQSVRLLTGQYEGTEAPPPETIAAVTADGQTWMPLRPYDGKTFLPGGFDEISTASGLLAVRKGGNCILRHARGNGGSTADSGEPQSDERVGGGRSRESGHGGTGP